MYLTKNGELHGVMPQLDEYVKDDQELSVEKKYRLMLFAEDDKSKEGKEIKFLGSEDFYKKPTKAQIKWAILKYKAQYADLRKVYELTL